MNIQVGTVGRAGDIEPARKRAKAMATHSIILGAAVLLAVAFVWTYYRASPLLNWYAQELQESACRICTEVSPQLAMGLKASVYGIIPALCLLLIGGGVSTLLYLRAEARAMLDRQ